MGWTRRLREWLEGEGGRGATALVALVIGFGPAWLFADALGYYRLRVDDFAYVADSRTLARTFANLFEPRNAHVVPVWRVLTWGVVAAAGRLTNLPTALALAAYGLLVGTMAVMGRYVARELGRATAGLAAMAALGTTALMEPAATWYSAAQANAAGCAVLGMLWFLQDWRRQGGRLRLALAALAACAAGWTWTIGYAAGPVGAVYLWADGRRPARRAAAVPLMASLAALALALALGGRRIDATTSFHGLTVREAFHPLRGCVHTLQVIPEELVFGNIGLSADTTVFQGALFTLALAAAWAWTRRGRGPIVPLEAAGATLVLLAYFVEWSARGYLPYDRSLREVVGWYDAVPQVGAVLFVAGWWGAGRNPALAGAVDARVVDAMGRATPPGPPLERGGGIIKSPPYEGGAGGGANDQAGLSVRSAAAKRSSAIRPSTRAGLLAILLFEAALLVTQAPRALAQFELSLPPKTAEEARRITTPEVRRLRALIMSQERARWQLGHLAKLEQVETRARQARIGRRAIHEAFGRLRAPELPKPEVYDALGLLDLPWDGAERDPSRVRLVLGPLLALDPEPASVLTRAALAVPPPRP
ncbi:MAG: hypothetical protein P4L84_19725 [Isosphaeraceae bacterium]|nr:hypothetical protein [Isosphaeraceae bacterium]